MAQSNPKMQTILFADIAGSTRLYEQLGDAPARMLIARCMERLMTRTQAKQGKVIKTIGDEVMCTFNLPDHAVSAAVAMQEDITADTLLSAQHMQLRIGLHHGPVIQEDADVYGDAVNIAARMVAHAKAGQIIISDITMGMLGRKHQSNARLVDHARIKGKQNPIDIYELSWGQLEELTMITTVGNHTGGSTSPTAMHLRYMDSAKVIDREHPALTMGRDPSNDIVLNDPRVSRLHARIELRKDKFVLVDQSTNGTFIVRQDRPAALLRWDEIPLPNQGMIALGENTASDSILTIQFRRS
ncbi:MAG: adenylate/guanylate cyclase domain-containing protein [Desulfobacteraceae bacterium]|nr:MAG: adenylate/guanylate cyclase domain-containing protein [Desulfobacteraceae bacterium]